MINISYYCLEDDEKCLKLEVFKSIHDERFRNSYNILHEEKLFTHLYMKSKSNSPFKQNELVNKELKKDGDNALPLVIINNEIVKRGDLLTVEELSDLLGIGISIQSDN
ncbi:arsenic metallochaperone ArsD family protein [Virgibacillus sp. 179-BFC.A HS]|uniref:Arsenic metallochaperone ArsD family protein n=1 Tax=Tigheibacillus jepli TaxID=3035914 RepID=A0ABU5CGH0_9BACI|nr:arsenic metallochaperone ArsD family protein [Virgibacillus sp. 179-BFC.A HS]MDY0405427.1 arsenic metallochaperone ArsD family protein [Virgibacillus sp. 179-BFC.A HS]